MESMEEKTTGGKETGTVIVTALLILLLLSIVGLAGTDSTIMEKAMVRSDAVGIRVGYLAESGAMEGVQKVENEEAKEELLPAWLSRASRNYGMLVEADARDPGIDSHNLDLNGDGTVDEKDIAAMERSETDPDGRTYRLVVLKAAQGSSTALGQSRLYDYIAYGYSEAFGGLAMIKVGFKKRF